MQESHAVSASGLVKAYRGVRVLDGVDLTVERGGVFALLGPNGAGKTTMVRILSTLLKPDQGTARVAGFDVLRQRAAVRERISLTGQHVAIDDLQTGEENLRMMGQLAGLGRAAATRRAAELIEEFELTEAAPRRVATYSGGMRRRLDIAAGLTRTPAVVFLDEPTSGLDPRSRIRMWQLVRALVERGATVFLTTQYLEEADQLADRVAVLDHGRVVADGTPAELKRRYSSLRLDLVAVGPTEFTQVGRALADRSLHSDPTHFVHGIATDGSAAHLRHVLEELDPTGSLIARVDLHRATLDDVFLALTGHAPRQTQETVNV